MGSGEGAGAHIYNSIQLNAALSSALIFGAIFCGRTRHIPPYEKQMAGLLLDVCLLLRDQHWKDECGRSAAASRWRGDPENPMMFYIKMNSIK